MRKLIKTVVIVIISSLMLPVSSVASDKNLSVQIDKEYEKARFSLLFENPGEYKATLTAPNGDVYEFEQISESDANVVIGKLKAGKYLIDVSNSDDDMGKVTVTVKGINDDTAVSSAIKVAKEISGLQMFLRDEEIVVQWTDETIGDVHVTISDAQTQEVLGNENVSGKEYVATIPSDTKEILVNVVPSESEKVSEAGEQYTILNENRPDALVTYSEDAFTNKEVVTAKIKLNDSYGLVFINNDQEVLKRVENLSKGEYTYDIPLVEGDNNVKVYVVSGNGNMRSTPLAIKRDTAAPQLTIESDINGISTKDEQIEIKGQVTDYNEFTINGNIVEPDWEGYFTQTIELSEGDNHIVVSAKDEAGNEALYDASVVHVIQENNRVTPQMIMTVLAICAVIIYLGIMYFKTHYQVVYEDIADNPEEDKENIADVIPVNKKNNFDKRKSIEALVPIVTGILAVIFIFRFVILAGYTASGSMEPMMRTGDIAVSNRLAYLNNEPQRGDIISFYHIDDESGIKAIFEKRIIGVEGDEISFSDGYVFINGKRAVEEYLEEDVETNCLKTFSVPKGCVFVLGDNRESSIDSRYWTEPYVSKKDIVAKLMVNLGH